jgi:hypothetical protein
MDIEMTGRTAGRGPAIGSAGLDVGNPLQTVAEVIGEALGRSPAPASAFAPAAPSAPQWSIEAGS